MLQIVQPGPWLGVDMGMTYQRDNTRRLSCDACPAGAPPAVVLSSDVVWLKGDVAAPHLARLTQCKDMLVCGEPYRDGVGLESKQGVSLRCPWPKFPQ